MPAGAEAQRAYRARYPERARESARRWREANANVVKNGQLRVKFGMTLEEYDALKVAQGGVCAICRQPEKVEGRDLAVDHCHDSSKVRGLLCGHCNRGLGFLGDDWRVLFRAAWYVLKARKA